MRRKLHVGGREDLNVYMLEPRLPRRDGGGQLLGWSTLPWQLGARAASVRTG